MKLTVTADAGEVAELLAALSGARQIQTSINPTHSPAHTAAHPAVAHPVHVERPVAELAATEADPELAALMAERPELFEKMRAKARHDAQHVLADAEFRVAQAREIERRTRAGEAPGEGGQVYAEDLNTLKHQITGYTVTGNPTTKTIAWTDVHVVYNGTDYEMANGTTTAGEKYVWFDPAISATVLQKGATKPDLGGKPNAALLFINNDGVPYDCINASIPGAVANDAVDSGALQTNAVTSSALAANAVVAGKIGTGAINASTLFATNVVDNNAIGTNAVKAGQLDTNAVTAGKIAAGAVNDAKIFAGKVVDSNALGDTAVTAGKIAAGAVNNSNIFAGKVVNSSALGDNAVVAGKINAGAINSSGLFGTGVVNETAIGNNAITAGKVSTGAITTAKLNVLSHFIY